MRPMQPPRHTRAAPHSGSGKLEGQRSPVRVLLLCQGRARFKGVEDDPDEETFEAADRLSTALALGLLPFEVGASGRVVASLRDRDSVKRGVELAVAAAVEPVPLHSA